MLSFTLSEVLITLVIIGIIAAITVPILMQNHKRKETAVRLKKFYSVTAQAIKLAETEEGIPSYDWKNHFSSQGIGIWYNYLSKYIPIEEKQEAACIDGSCHSLYFMTDGTAIRNIDWGSADNSDYGCIHYDVNGAKGPNQFGKDRFGFSILRKRGLERISKSLSFFPEIRFERLLQENITREELLEDCKSFGGYCTYLIMYDGWEIKNDYPYRL